VHSLRSIKTIPVLCFLLFVSQDVRAQTVTGTQDVTREYYGGLIIKKDRTRFEGDRLLFSPRTLTFTDRRTGKTVELPLDEVEFVSAQTGTHALEGALIGGGICLLASLEAVAEVSADPSRKLKENAGEVVAIVTGVGAGVGLLIGAMIPKEATVYQKGKLVFLPGSTNPVTAGIPGNVTLLSLRVSL